MTMNSVEFTLLTPTFACGVDQTQPELRVPTIKGQLRWWARAILGNGKPEYDLFGGIKGKLNGYPGEDAVAGPFVFRLVAPRLPISQSALCPHDGSKGQRKALQPRANAVFELRWFSRLHSRAPMAAAPLRQIVDTWLLLGSVGCRSNRAAGSVWRAGYLPDLTSFERDVLALQLPANLSVRVLGEPLRQPDDLRGVATDTLQGRPPQTGNIRGLVLGDVFGYVAGKERKASPLKLKVGHFADGYRLIAVFDLRPGRADADQFHRAANSLKSAGKRLGKGLVAALQARPLR